jgi:hypothetical protein
VFRDKYVKSRNTSTHGPPYYVEMIKEVCESAGSVDGPGNE